MTAKKGDWVEIRSIVLEAGERAPGIPKDTAAVPLILKVKGVLQDEQAEAGAPVTVETRTGRRAKGELVAVNPGYTHNYGSFIPETLRIADELRTVLEACDG